MAMNYRIYLTSFSSSLQGMVQTSLPLCPCFVHRFRLWGTVLFLLILSSCKNGEEKNTVSKYYPTKILSPVSRTIQTPYPAVLKGRQSVEIRPQCSGLIMRICIEEGACVKKGQILFIIDQAPYLAALKTASANVSQAEARLATVRLTFDSKEVLCKKNIVSDYELQTARNELKAAEATLEQMQAQCDNARTELSYTEVKSPVDGVAGMIPYRVGALVDRNIAEPLVCVSDTEEMFAYFSISESDELAKSAKLGTQKITFRPVNKAIPVVNGVIDAVSGTMDARTGTISVRARIPNHDKILYDGSTGTVLVSSERTDCLVISQTAAYEIQNRTFVYKVVDGRTVSTSVEVEDIGNGKEYIVLSGLKAGDKIVTEGVGLLREGTEITESITTQNASQ